MPLELRFGYTSASISKNAVNLTPRRPSFGRLCRASRLLQFVTQNCLYTSLAICACRLPHRPEHVACYIAHADFSLHSPGKNDSQIVDLLFSNMVTFDGMQRARAQLPDKTVGFEGHVQ